MININLLPEVMRKKERMPLPQLLSLIGMFALILPVFYLVTLYQFDTIPSLRQRKSSLEGQKRQLEAQAAELKQINAEIARLSEYVDTVKGLYRNRIVWAKILSDVKHIVNFDSGMGVYNPEMRYIWLNTLSGKGKELSMKGLATGSDQVAAMQMPERLLREFLVFSPVNLPEKDEEERLQNELAAAIRRHQEAMRSDSSLPLQGSEEIELRQRLEQIKSVKSGGIAMQPFSAQLVPGSLKLNNVTWGGAPQPPRTRTIGATQDAILTEIFPTNAWAFDIVMNLK